MSEEPQEQSLDAVRSQIAWLHGRMEEIRAATEVEVLKAWTSPWKSADTVRVKVDTRLASNHEFRALMTKGREVEAREAQLAADHVDPDAGSATGGHSAVR